MQPSWSGHFINLDRAAARRAAVEAELQKAGIADAYRRYPAIDGAAAGRVSPLKPAEVGCFCSHAAVLALDAPSGQLLHVLEDDIVLSSRFASSLRQLIAAGALAGFDLVFTDVILAAPHISTIRSLKAAYDQAMATAPDIRLRVLDLRDSNFGGANSYFVNPASRAKVSALAQAELTAGPNTLIDMLYRREVQRGTLRAGVIFPFLSGVHLEHAAQSSIGFHFQSEIQARASDLLRAAFSVEPDFPAMTATLNALKGPTAGDRHLAMLRNILRLLVAG